MIRIPCLCSVEVPSTGTDELAQQATGVGFLLLTRRV